MLTHRERWRPKLTQADLMRQRIASGAPGPLPTPGVFARHNAVDTPALLPDGTLAEQSVPAPLRARGDLRPVDIGAVEETRALTEGEAVFGPTVTPVADDPGASPGERP